MTVIQSTSSDQSEEKIRDFLQAHSSGVLATADKASNPHAAVVYYLVQDDFSLLFVTKTETQKYKNIQENNQVALVVYDETHQTTLQLFGHAVRVDDTEKIVDAIRELSHRSSMIGGNEQLPAEKLLAGGFVALRLAPQLIKMASFGATKEAGDEDLYETILFAD